MYNWENFKLPEANYLDIIMNKYTSVSKQDARELDLEQAYGFEKVQGKKILDVAD